MDQSYFDIINDAMKENSFIGVSLAKIDDQSLEIIPHEVLGIGKPVYVQKQDDGSMKVLLKGIHRAKIKNKLYNIPYPTYEVEILPDLDSEDDLFVNDSYEFAETLLLDWLYKNIDNQEERDKFIHTLEGPNSIVDYLCTFLVRDPAIKQMMLEISNRCDVLRIVKLLLSGPSDFEEDFLITNALKNYQEIEKITKIAN